ncbi:LADA_0F01860g1_1 [Lachancea dasiensis]|uniref:LADA_0F01860g1_1 n=1 Tax=Lachancea dasiensis TaxID=1072105 RepID=A0A1G4JID3_9SACH|nr:LADA_0F01860g1_1 [Lachancea dasiensis]
MLGLRNSQLYTSANQSAMSSLSRDEKFDYDDEASDENDEPGTSLGKFRAENGFSFKSFIDQINAKTKALAIARELDAKRGIIHQDAISSAGSIDSTSSISTGTQQAQESTQSRATVRRVPSGARATTADPNLGASTPMKDVSENEHPHNQTINDLIVQSTPLNMSKSAPSTRSTQPRDILKEKFVESHKAQREDVEMLDDREPEQKNESRIKTSTVISETVEDYPRESSPDHRDQKISELQRTVKIQEQDANDLIKNVEVIQEQLNAQQAVTETMKDQNAISNEELRRISEQVLLKDAEVRKLKNDIDIINLESNNRIQKLQGEVYTLQDNLNTSEVTISELRNTINCLQSDKEDMSKRLEERKIEVCNLKAQAAKEIEQCQSREAERNSELESASAEVIYLKERTSALQNDMEEQSKSNVTSISELRAEISNLAAQNDLFKQQLNSRDVELSRQSKSHQNKVLDLERKVMDSEQGREKITIRYDMLEKQHSELQNSRIGLEATNTDLKNVVDRLEKLAGEQLQTIGKLEKEAMRNKQEETSSVLRAEKRSQQLEEKIQSLEDSFKAKVSEADAAVQEKRSLLGFLENITLFQTPLGNILLEQYNKGPYCTQLDSMFTSEYPQRIGFLTQSMQDRVSATMAQLEDANTMVTKLQESIENEWQVKTHDLSDELATEELKVTQLDAELQALHLTLRDKAARVVDLETNMQDSLRDKEADIKRLRALGDEVSRLKFQLADNQCKSVLELSGNVEHLNKKNMELQEKMRELEVLNQQQECTLVELTGRLDEERASKANSQDELVQLRRDLAKACGNPARRITFQMASQVRPHLTRREYESLMVDAVNDMDVVDLQNVVKNLILLLEIPLSKITKKMPLVAIYLRYEKSICLHFANKLHNMIFRETIDIKRFTNSTYAQYQENHDICHLEHPLEACLDNLYRAVSSRMVSSP